MLVLEHTQVGGRVCIPKQYFILKSSGFGIIHQKAGKLHKKFDRLLRNTFGLQSQTQNAACKPWIFKAVALVNSFPVNVLYKVCLCSSVILNNVLPVVKVSWWNNKCPRLALIAATKLLIVTWEFSPTKNSVKEKGLTVPKTRVSWEVCD